MVVDYTSDTVFSIIFIIAHAAYRIICDIRYNYGDRLKNYGDRLKKSDVVRCVKLIAY